MPGRLRLVIEAPPQAGLPTGPQMQAAFLGLVDVADAVLARELHDGGSPPLYHCAVLPPSKDGRLVLCAGLLRDGDLPRIQEGWARQPPAEVRCGALVMRVVGVLTAQRDDPETGVVPFPSLGEEGRDARGVVLRFLSPTLFRSPTRGEQGSRPVRAWPSPERVLDSLARRLARAAVENGQEGHDPGWADEAAQHINEVGGGGEIVGFPGERRVRGFVGEAHWHFAGTLGGHLRRVLVQSLALAPFSGVGSRSPQGCGCVAVRWG